MGDARAAGRVLAIAEEERELVCAGRTDELAELHDRRAAAMAELPQQLSEEARGALSHALALQRQIGVALRDALATTGTELGQVAQGRTAARGYAPPDLDPRRVLDRTA
jgi:hypothetical protein